MKNENEDSKKFEEIINTNNKNTDDNKDNKEDNIFTKLSQINNKSFYVQMSTMLYPKIESDYFEEKEKFTETYSFYSHHSVNQRMDYLDKEKCQNKEFLEKFKSGFPFLIIREYKFNEDSPVHNDINMLITDLSNEELKKIIRKRFTDFLKYNDSRYRKFFFSALIPYIKILTLSEIENELFPLISKNLISFSTDVIIYLIKILFNLVDFLYKENAKIIIQLQENLMLEEKEKNNEDNKIINENNNISNDNNTNNNDIKLNETNEKNKEEIINKEIKEIEKNKEEIINKENKDMEEENQLIEANEENIINEINYENKLKEENQNNIKIDDGEKENKNKEEKLKLDEEKKMNANNSEKSIPDNRNYLLNTENKISLIKGQIIPILFQIYMSKFFFDLTVKNCLFNTILLIAHKVKDEECTTLLLSKLIDTTNTINLFSDESRVENFLTLTKIIHLIIDDYSEEYNEKLIFANLQILSCDNNDSVRKGVVKTLPLISRKISFDFHKTKLRSVYKMLCIDKDANIRIESVNILPDLMKDNQEKSQFSEGNEYYIDIFNKFMLDQDKSVRIATLTTLGRILMLLDMNELDKKYLDFYKNAIDEYYFYRKEYNLLQDSRKNDLKNISNSNNNNIFFIKSLITNDDNYDSNNPFLLNNIINSIALNFPSMLFRYGKDSWNILKAAYFKLCEDEDINVITKIIKSFYNIGTILGSDIVKKDLINIYNKFLYSKELKIQEIAIENLSNFLKLLDFENKKKYVKFVGDYILKDIQEKIFITKNVDLPFQENIVMFYNYNHKYKATKNINYYFDLYYDEKIFSNFLRLEFVLCCDKIHIVRMESANTLGNIILYLYNKDFRKEILIKIIQGFALSKNFQNRIEFLYICKFLLVDKKIFNEILFDLIINCYFDTVFDVQVQLALLINYVLKQENLNLNYLLKDKDFFILSLLIYNHEILSDYLSIQESIYNIFNIKEDDEEINNYYKQIINNKKHILTDDLIFQEVMLKLNLKMEIDKQREKENEKNKKKSFDVHIIS